MKRALSVLLMLGLVGVNSAAAAGSYVTKVGTYGNGSIFVMFDVGLSGCNTATRFDIPANGTNDATIKNVLSIAMAAKASGNPVQVAVNGCTGNTTRGNFDSSLSSYIYLGV